MIEKDTQQAKILFTMINNPKTTWWYPQDFMKPDLGDLFVGYEASARLSELAKDYPEMIDSKRDGKYKVRRLRFENSENFKHLLPETLRWILPKTQQQKDFNINQKTLL